MTSSPFHQLQVWTAPPGYALHNVRLLDVQPDDAGCTRLIVECQGETCELQGGGRWNEEYSRRDVGKIGHLVLAPELTEQPASYFRAYLDQSLRRAPELDAPDRKAAAGQQPNVVGWRCEARPDGFRAPVGLVPGKNGDFVPDWTVPVALRVPIEFVTLSRRYRLSPDELLRAFVGDVCGLMNLVASPRADGYGSNGSDERDLADQWLERAFAHHRIEEENSEMDGDPDEYAFDVFDDLMDQYSEAGGDPQEIVDAVRTMVEKKRQKD